MATTEEISTDILWEEMKTVATEQQQDFYENLPDTDTEYKFDEHKYLQKNIGYAIYGPPTITKNTSTTESNNDADITDTVDYDDRAKKVIDVIYQQICKCSIETDNSRPIYFSIIYNIIFRPKMKIKPKEKKETKTIQEETKKKIKDEKDLFIISYVPIFKIRRQRSVPNNGLIQSEADYEIWYIDTGGRVYKSWKDYIENNTLPECTMVLPKDGFYQADVSCPVAEDYSTVWLEIVDSPACSWKVKLSNGMDIISSVVGFGVTGLCVASMFTPIAPVVTVTGLVATGATGGWTISRCSQQLIDRSKHEESIDLRNKDAFACWLGIVGSAVGLGAVGGSMAISRVAANGVTIPASVQVTFNTMQRSNIVLSGIGIVYQGYCMADKYKTGQGVDHWDVLNLATHIMFFANSVVNVKFANDIIKDSQGRVIDEYKESLRSKNLRKKFNRTLRKAAENNTSKISENIEVIRYIKNRQQLLSVDQSAAGSKVLDKTTRNIVWSVEQGKLRVNGIKLLDPVDYVRRLIQLGIFVEASESNSLNSQNYVQSSTVDRLIKMLCDLLSKHYLSNCPKNMPTVPDFEPLIKEMSYMNVNEDCLKMLFTIAERLIRRSKDMEDFLLMAITFVWLYCKENLKQWGINSFYRMRSDSGSNILRKIIIAITEAIDMMLNNLFNAFSMYLNDKLRE